MGNVKYENHSLVKEKRLLLLLTMLRFSSTFCKRITTRDAIANRIGIRGFATERAKSLVKPGNILIVDGKPHRVKDIQHGKRGKGGAFVR